ncbi:hypothetical protein Poly41_58260 [Novipirellula artificiosorum]|uniref:Uncharacterized protein n=2 Tax=Novipirellula artificiosorum TaxID=2528016 RepID=A0A5C6D569_9BACT|nr:hypothetical protein Poly41_58260 [Novipirellula artificiosorum]
MSNSSVYSERKSWRQTQSSGGNRWIGRILFTLIALLLLAWLVYFWLRRQPARELRAFLIQPGSLDGDVIMPTMYGASATEAIVTNLKAVEINGTAASIQEQLQSTTELKERLSDSDDCVLVIVRGYLLAGPDGEPMIACSDLQPGTESDTPKGLLPLTELLAPMAADAPAQFTGTRLVVLDIEPFATLPRLGQSDDQAFANLSNVVANLKGPDVDSLWVMVTRGPLQNVGWNTEANLPISTATLIDALGGEANFNDDYEISLDELCNYMAARYKRLEQRGDAECPQIMMLRGGIGRITKQSEIEKVWITSSMPAVEPEPIDDTETNDQSPQKNVDGTTDNPTGDAASDSVSMQIRPVRYQTPIKPPPALGADEQPDTARPAADGTASGPAQAAGGPAQAAGGPAQAAGDASGTPETSADTMTDSEVPEATSSPNSFWDYRDWLETNSTFDRPHPIAIAPQLWQRLIVEILHADIETLDPNADQSKVDRLVQTTNDLGLLIRSVESARNQTIDQTGDPSDYSDVLVLELASRWRTARPSNPIVDEQVRAANELQLVIAVARSRLYSRLLYREQAILSKSPSLADDFDWPKTLTEAEHLLAEQNAQPSGNHVDVTEMQEQTRLIRSLITQSDSEVQEKIANLLEQFGRVDEGNSWPVIRRAQAWLRSPLPSGKLRRKIIEKLAATRIERVDTQSIEIRIASSELSAQTPPNAIVSNQLLPLKRDYSRFVALEPGSQRELPDVKSYTLLSDHLRAADSGFRNHFAAALRIAPSDADAEDHLSPIIHRVVAAPRVRDPKARILDASDRPIQNNELTMQATMDSLQVEVQPDSDRTSSYRIIARQRQLDQLGFSKPPLELTWRAGSGVQKTATDDTITLTVSARDTGVARLDLRALRERDESSSATQVAIRIEPIDQAMDPALKQLESTRVLGVRLPQSDQVRVAVMTEGLSKEVVSGNDNLAGGVWLRTFASRRTSFSLSLFNESGRPARARVWLLKLKNPFVGEKISAYWPDLLAHRIGALESPLLNANGRVDARVLSGAQVLKGPAELSLGSGEERTPLTWNPPPSADSATAANATAASPPANVTDVDVSHGMALVVRLLDESGNAKPGNDEIVWLIPRPWSPEDYVEITSLQFRAGEVTVDATLKSKIDGDQSLDEIPEIKMTPVTVRWTQDDQWDRFERDSTGPRREQSILLSPGTIARRMEVLVPNRNETNVRLDVDGWPRAIRRAISHHEGGRGNTRTRWDTIDFSSVSIDYGDTPTSLSADDLPISATTVYFPSRVFFRGNGQSLTTVISADLSADLYEDRSTPEIRLLVDSHTQRRYWTDRIVSTLANSIGDGGQIELTTDVNDLTEVWTSEAKRADDQISFQAEIQIKDEVKRSAFELTLDTTPPQVQRPRPSNFNTPYLGESVTWNVDCADVIRNNASSGISRVVVGVDQNGDGKPDTNDRTFVSEQANNLPRIPRALRTFTPEKVGRFAIAVQAWDAVGLASQGASDAVDVKARPPKPKPAPASAEMNAQANPPAGAKPLVAAPPMLGRIKGRIESRSAMRGKLVLSPAPDKIRPGDTIEVGGANPAFDFSNVPAGEYTLTFQGTVNNSTRTYVWSGLKIDVAGGKPSLSLSPAAAESK